MIVSEAAHTYDLRVCDGRGKFEEISWFGSGYNICFKILELVNSVPVESNCTVGNPNPGVESTQFH